MYHIGLAVALFWKEVYKGRSLFSWSAEALLDVDVRVHRHGVAVNVEDRRDPRSLRKQMQSETVITETGPGPGWTWKFFWRRLRSSASEEAEAGALASHRIPLRLRSWINMGPCKILGPGCRPGLGGA